MEVTFEKHIKQQIEELGFLLGTSALHVGTEPSTLGKIGKDEKHSNLEPKDSTSPVLQADKNSNYTAKIEEGIGIVNQRLRRHSTSQQTIKFDNDWREKEFSNPNAIIRVGTMFSGIGAIEYALKRLNLNTEIQFACDIDDFVKQSYFANYEIGASNWYKDVCEINGEKYKGQLDLLVGGSPSR